MKLQIDEAIDLGIPIRAAWKQGGKDSVDTLMAELINQHSPHYINPELLILAGIKVGKLLGQTRSPDEFILELEVLDLGTAFPALAD